jgi:hypothetical protein
MSTIKKRPANMVRSVFRITRNILAVLGVCFVYLLVMGYSQYEDRVAAGDVACTLTHCA